MFTYTCKCGEMVVWSSMGVSPCNGCKKCNTVPSAGTPFREPIPHHFITRYNETTGEPYKVCDVCWIREKDL